MLAVYERLKHGSASEASKLLERIRTEDEIPGFTNHKPATRRATNDSQLAAFDTTPRLEHEESQTGPYAWLGRTTSSRLKPAPEVVAIPQWTGLIDPNLSDNSEKHSDFSLPPSVSQPVSLEDRPTNEYPQRGSYSRIGLSHMVLLWPQVVSHIKESGVVPAAEVDLQCVARCGSPLLLQTKTSKHCSKLPCNIGLPSSTSNRGSIVFPSLTNQQVDEYSSAYFNTFNILLPLLDLDLFMDGIVARLLREGYRDDDPKSVLALLVFALGQLAIEGVTGHSTMLSNDGFGDFRRGTIEKPPGLGLFNEARRRIGMVTTQPCLENVQIMLLQATYFESSARHTDFWSSTSAASLACTCLIKSQEIDWTSLYGDLVKRAYWVCLLQERLFDLEFRLGSTGIESLEDQIPLPHIHETVQREGSPDRSLPDDFVFFDVDKDDTRAFCFIAMITFSRLIRRVDNTMHGYEPGIGETELLWQASGMQTLVEPSTCLPSTGGYSEPPSGLALELLHELDCWRNALPQRIQWSDEDFINSEEVEPLTTALNAKFFDPCHKFGFGQLDHNDIAVALLRTRFYHARFLICRPFIYKALHLPELITADDRIKCASAIDAALLWSLSLSPPRNKKHLVPQLFSFTQNSIAMIFVLRMCCKSNCLSDICKENGLTRERIESTINSMISWLEDVRQVDGAADWTISALGPAFF